MMVSLVYVREGEMPTLTHKKATLLYVYVVLMK